VPQGVQVRFLSWALTPAERMFNGGLLLLPIVDFPTLPILFQHSSQLSSATSDSNPQTNSSCMDSHHI